MAPPLSEAASGSRSTSVPSESKAPDEQETSAVFSFSDPTFNETVERLRLGVGDWTIKGPRFEDGTQPLIHVDHRLGEAIVRALVQMADQTLSRRERQRHESGEPLKSIRLVKKTTPDAVKKFGDSNCSEGPNN